MREYETVIGLEVHVELASKSKIFCSCSTEFGAQPNTHTCPVCAGMPGTLPVLNRQVVEYAMAVGLALGCRINPICHFDRKNYFYPDNPQNYQISQLYQPICLGGGVKVGDKTIRIHEIHMEEDAGKLIHQEETGETLIDYNRAGVPLIEIVSEPDMRNAEEVIAYLEALRQTIQYLGASDCKLNQGSMRADVNLSLRQKGEEEYETRTEMKNLNSFKAIARAIQAEADRQMKILEAGQEVLQETRRWDDLKGQSYSMRSKEDAKDYRYFPDPDLPPLVIDEAWVEAVKKAQPEFADAKAARYQKEFGLPDYDIAILTGDKALADLFEATTDLCHKPKKVSNWLMGEAMRLLKERELDWDQVNFAPDRLADLIGLTEEGKISMAVAKEIFEKIFDQNIDPLAYVEKEGLGMVQDQDQLASLVQKVVDENPQSVSDYRAGKKKAMGYLMGQLMRATKGQADPGILQGLLREILEK